MIKRVPLYAEMHRFIPAMSSLAGARIAQIKVNHRARQHGRSKYGLSRVYKVLADLIAIKTLLLFAARPLVLLRRQRRGRRRARPAVRAWSRSITR